MTDDDFDKIDEDFASEFDFVDNKQGPGSSTPSGSPQPPKGSPAIITLMVIISILGGGYYAYNHFFGKKEDKAVTEKPAIPGEPKASEKTLMRDDHIMPQPTATAPNPNAVAEELNKSSNELSSALPTSASSDNEKTFEQMQKDIQSAKQTQIMQPAATPQQPVEPAVSTEVRNALQTISEEMTENVNNIRQLEGTISNIASTLEHLNRTISAMDNRMLALTETVDSLSQDLTNVKRVMVEQDLDLTLPGNNMKVNNSGKRQMQSISSSQPNYNIHAIIPGRAWLKSTNGQIITVTEGDKLGDYGTVAVIDAANGLVRTSSGIIIR